MRRSTGLSVVLMLFYLMSTLTLALMAVVTAELQISFGLSASALGLLTSGFTFAYGAVGVPAGVVAARWGGRVLALSCTLFVTGSLLFGLSSSYSLLLTGRALQGLGGGMVLPVSSSVMASHLAPEDRTRGWGIFAAGKGLGALTALLLMPSVSELGGFRAVYLVTAGMAVLVGTVALCHRAVRALPAEISSPEAAGDAAGLLRAVTLNRNVLLLGLFNAASLAVGTGVLVWTPDFLSAQHSSGAAMAAYLTAGLAVAQLLGAPAGAKIAMRWGRMPVIAGAMLGMTVAAACVPLMPGQASVLLAVLLVGFFSLAYFSPRFALVPEVVASARQVGPAAGLINLLGFGISTLAPWLFGLALDRGLGYSAAYLVLAGFGAAGALGAAFFRLPK